MSHSLPDRIESEEALDEIMTRPRPALVRFVETLEGPLLILGAGGKMGPSLAALAKRAADAAGRRLSVIAVSRFTDSSARDWLEARSIRTICSDLMDRGALERLPDAPDVIYMVGRKFGTGQSPETTWAINALLPARVAERYPNARVAALSTGNVYPLVPVDGGGSLETDDVTPSGEYANSCVARERVLGYVSRRHATRVVLIRLSYALDLRYGVLVDIATGVHAGKPVDVSMGYVNCIWQGDANEIIRSLGSASSPASAINVTGSAPLSVRNVAVRFGELLGRQARIIGTEGTTAFLSNTAVASAMWGAPATPLDSVIRWTAHWVATGGRLLNKPTHFEVRDGDWTMAADALPPRNVLDALRDGLVIPAHPLALRADRSFDERRQRALTRYYHAAGAGGIAVGVHSTQFEIREARYGLFSPVLELAAETIAACDRATGRRTVAIAGVCGTTRQALSEARLASDLGYDAGLLSLSALPEASNATLLAHCREVATAIPLMGFYLQPAAGGRLLNLAFWRGFVEIPNVVAVKIAPFDRYQTLDVVRAVAESGRSGEIALYTGNDDNIVLDLLTPFAVPTAGNVVTVRIVGGLLGHWACWTLKAFELLAACQRAIEASSVPIELLTLAGQITDCNAAFFDAAHAYAGAIPGISEVLRRQGLLENTFCLDPDVGLSPGQAAEIERVCRAYPHLADDAFVAEHLDDWLS